MARVLNIGAQPVPAGAKVFFYDGDPDQGGVLLGMSLTTKELYPAEAEDVLLPLPGAPDALKSGQDPLFAVVNPGQEWIECRPANNKSEGSGICL